MLLIAIVLGAIGTNIAPNPSFEDDTKGWTPFTAWGEGSASLDETSAHTGTHSIRITGIKPVTQQFVRTEEIPVAPGEQFHASAWVKTQNLVGDPGALVMADFLEVDGHSDAVARFAIVPKEANGKWIKVEGKITVPSHCSRMRFRLGMWNSKGTAWFDDVQLEPLTPLSCRLDLPTPRIPPSMTTAPITLINRTAAKGPITATLSESTSSLQTSITLDGTLIQHLNLPLPKMPLGPGTLKLQLPKSSDQSPILIPDPATLNIPIPCYWAIEDGPPQLDGEVDLALTTPQLSSTQITLELKDPTGHTVAHSSLPLPLHDGLNPFHLTPPSLPLGKYTLIATATPPLNNLIPQPFTIIPRDLARTTLNSAGYLVSQGKPIFPLGVFNGAGKSPELAASGFTIQHAYNACDVIEGQTPNDAAALQFLDNAQAAGLKCLFLIPRGFVFANDWDAFRRRIRMFRNHPALLAWDEEEGLARGDLTLEGLKKMASIIREEDPNHPLMIGDSRDEIEKIDDRATLFPADVMDLGMWWWYPIPPRPKGGTLLNGDDLTNAYELTPPSFLTRATTTKPIWVGVQSYKKEFPSARYPTPAEYRAQAYLSIIHGAKGLLWYGGYVDGGLFTAPDSQTHLSSLKSLAAELHSLSDLLMSQTLPSPSFQPPHAPISLIRKRAGENEILITCNRDQTPLNITLQIGGPNRTLPVLNESRQVQVLSGTLTDHFPPYAVHIYQLSH